MGRMATIDARRMLKALARLGWSVVRVKGSHHFVAKPGAPSAVVPVHPGRTMKEGTARSILAQLGISEDDFFAKY
jgi:predicted RNA binding protein YcfA (HicA-like mRNA interferase family)